MRGFTVSCVIAVVLCPLRLAADSFHYTLPLNADVIREPGGTAGGIGLSGAAYVTQSYAAANDPLTPHGLPDNGLVKGVQLGPYNGNNALLLGTNSGTLLSIPPPYFFVLHVYAAADEGFGGFGGTAIKLSINKSHAVLYDQQSVSNWLNGGDFIGGMDTTGPGGNGFSDLNRAGISDISFFVDNRDRSINSIFVENFPPPFAGGANVYLFAVEAMFPEPGTASTVTLAALLLARRRRPLRGFGG